MRQTETGIAPEEIQPLSSMSGGTCLLAGLV